MRIGLLVTGIGDYGKKGFYNLQEVGLAKGLSPFFERIEVYRLVAFDQKKKWEKIPGHENISLHLCPARSWGCHGRVDTSTLDADLDILLYFSDTQSGVPKVYRWAKKNHIQFFPYIGVIESHSNNRIKRIVMWILFQRVLVIYKRCHCFVKTRKVGRALRGLGVEQVTVAPVGVDLSLMHQGYEQADPDEIRSRYGYGKDDKILLFIGRLIEEKRPIDMVRIFADVVRMDGRYKLLMVGAGRLGDAVGQEIERCGIKDKVRLIGRIQNRDIWELYRMADAFVNLNRQEIFGMSILEAMYYGCKVIAWKAPGPEMIIEDGVSGWIVKEDGQIIDRIIDTKGVGKAAHERIVEHFAWEQTARLMASSMVGRDDEKSMDRS